MFIGACAGSTGGGSKVVRVAVLMKSARRALYKAFNPRAVKHIYLDGEILEEETVGAVANYYLIYFLTLAISVILVTVDGFSMETNFTAVVSCLNNVGPGMDAVGAVMNYSAFSAFSKIILSIVMLIGRLEIFPILVIFVPQVWKK
jgi:trk system potassium uptake protein TrkH